MVEALAFDRVLGDPAGLDDRPCEAWQAQRMAFLAAVSRALLARPEARALPALTAFAYWARKANLARLRAGAGDDLRMGLGQVFHLCPANVPINAAYSLAFGLLAGNANVLRLPTRDDGSLAVVCAVLEELLARPEFTHLASAIALVRYPREAAAPTAAWSASADARMIWGGDATVQALRAHPVPPHAREIVFPDRYSLCVIWADAVLAAGDAALMRLAMGMANDLFLQDQAACSSPHAVIWIGADAVVAQAQSRLWPAVNTAAEARHPLSPIRATDRLVAVCDQAAGAAPLDRVGRLDAAVMRCPLTAMPEDLSVLRGVAGTVYELALPALAPLASQISRRFQTLTYFGRPVAELGRWMRDQRLCGIDRIVPVGQALDMDLRWDGYNVVDSLTRLIDLRPTPDADAHTPP